MYFSPDIINQLGIKYQQLLKKHSLLYGYGAIVYVYSQSSHRLIQALRLHAGEDETLVQDLERCIPALSGKAITTFQVAEATQRSAIIPVDMMGGESFLTAVTPADCLIIGFKGSGPLINHQIIKDMLHIITNLEVGLTAEQLSPRFQFNPAAIMAPAV